MQKPTPLLTIQYLLTPVADLVRLILTLLFYHHD